MILDVIPAKTEEGMIEAMTQIRTNLDNSSLVNQSVAEKERYLTWFDPKNVDKTNFKMNKTAKLTAVVQGCSAALGIRQFMKAEGEITNKIADLDVEIKRLELLENLLLTILSRTDQYFAPTRLR